MHRFACYLLLASNFLLGNVSAADLSRLVADDRVQIVAAEFGTFTEGTAGSFNFESTNVVPFGVLTPTEN